MAKAHHNPPPSQSNSSTMLDTPEGLSSSQDPQANFPASPTHCAEFLIDRLTQLEDLTLKSRGLPVRYRDLSVFTSKTDQEIVQDLSQTFGLTVAAPIRWFHKLVVLFNSSCSSYISPKTNPSLTSCCQVPILCKADGVINQSEMLLVLARPKGGMTSLLRAISLNHQSFSEVDGHLDFGSLPIASIDRLGLKPLIVMVDETDQHLSSLNVQDTLQLAAKCRTPRSRPDQISRVDWANSEVQNWSSIFGLSSTTLRTALGSVSGGERKRVSVIEALLTRCSVLCLDNVTAGLDSVNSYHLIRSLKEWTSINQTSTIIGLRQASDRLYDLFDKVSVLYHGHQIYFGPTSEALDYFHQLGFLQTQNQPNTDFLCSVTDPLTRKIRPDAQHTVPETPFEFVEAFKRSQHHANLKHEMLQYDSRYPSSGAAQHTIYTVPNEKDTLLRPTSSWTINYLRQLIYLTSRQYALIKADLRPYVTKTIINLTLSLIIGSLFYQLPNTTEAAFSRGSVLFLSLLFNGYLQLSELGSTLMGREIIQRHGRFGFYSPSALALARTLSDVPLITAQVLIFATTTYGLAGLRKDFIRFAIYIVIVDATAINLTAAFRLFATVSSSFDEAVRYCGLALNIFVVHGGFFIPTPSVGEWLKWIRFYLDPIYYAFEAVLSNEFHGLKLQCSPQHVVPRGSSYNDPKYQTCSTLGSKPNSLVVLGDDYILQSYGFEYRHIWFNLAVITVLNVIFLILSVIFTEYFPLNKFGSTRIFKNSAKIRIKFKSLKKMLQLDGRSIEEGISVDCETLSERVQKAHITSTVTDETFSPAQFDSAVLTFTNLKLSIKDQSHSRTLLDGLDGYFQPGEMTALMGESGAGKTTLLNALAARVNYAQLSGEVLIDGRLPTADSFRAIGYVEQVDYHDEYSTVREALTFSALLRQPKSIPQWAKIADVDRVITWLGLKDLEDAIIGTPLAGLGLEDRKKLSIAVELVARPRILCLDEPVSGMDSQSATHIMQLLRRLVSQSNLTVIATVHQPSVEIFESFDRLILLQKEGKMAYFGPRVQAVTYLEARSSRLCGKTEHPAEYLIDSIRNSAEKNEDRFEGALGLYLNQAPDSVIADQSLSSQWRSSVEHTTALDKIKKLNSEAAILDQSMFNKQRGGSILTEINQLTKRFSRHFWRDSSFSFTQIFTATLVSMIIGSSFFQQASSSSESLEWIRSTTIRRSTLTGLSNQVFSIFLILFIPPVFMNQLITKWFHVKTIYKTREKLNGSYRELSLVVGFFFAELPYSILCAFIFWFIWFFSVGFRVEIEAILFTLMAVELFFLFQTTWAIWIVALSPSIGVVSNLLPFFLISMEAFNGSFITYDQMPTYWRWMYWVSPFQWYVKSVLAMVLHGQKVSCKPVELVKYLAPNSISCEKYSNEFLRQHTGYLMQTMKYDLGQSKSSTEVCEYCQYKTGDEFLTDRFKTTFSQSYTSLMIFGSYCLFNICLIFVIMLCKRGGISRFNLVKNHRK